MACMEHECTRCDWATMNNETVVCCPRCAARVRSYFDEDMDRDMGDNERDDVSPDER